MIIKITSHLHIIIIRSSGECNLYVIRVQSAYKKRVLAVFDTRSRKGSFKNILETRYIFTDLFIESQLMK